MKKFALDLFVCDVEKINEKYVLIRLTNDKPLPEMLPGQFVEVKVDNSPETFLRRPISINYVDRVKNELWLLVAIVGSGTQKLSQLEIGSKLNCILPLGNGFTLPSSKNENVLLIGGGVGVAPLLYFGQCIKDIGLKPTFLLGARTSKDLLELDYFRSIGDLYITSEDGSEGEKGYVTDHSILKEQSFNRISTCGPKPMMMSVARYAKKTNIDCEVSLENKMACGIGACLCCVEKTDKGNLCVCKEGPVFNTKQLLWQI